MCSSAGIGEDLFPKLVSKQNVSWHILGGCASIYVILLNFLSTLVTAVKIIASKDPEDQIWLLRVRTEDAKFSTTVQSLYFL